MAQDKAECVDNDTDDIELAQFIHACDKEDNCKRRMNETHYRNGKRIRILNKVAHKLA